VARPPNLAGHQIVARPPNLAVILTHCDQLILRKNSKFDATRCQILRLNAQNSVSAGARAGGAYSAPPDPLAVFRGLFLRGGNGEGKEKGRRGESEGWRPAPKYFGVEPPLMQRYRSTWGHLASTKATSAAALATVVRLSSTEGAADMK